MLLGDLGDELLLNQLNQNNSQNLYLEAIRILVQFQKNIKTI